MSYSQVGECFVLEKAWHVVFGLPAEMPPPLQYNQLRLLPGISKGESRFVGGAGECSVLVSNRSILSVDSASKSEEPNHYEY